MHLMKHVIDMLDGAQPPLPNMTDEDWLAYVHSFLLPLNNFRAGFISTRFEVWQLYFQHFGMTSKAKRILQWLQHGLGICWVPHDASSQQKHPRYNKKVQLVRKLLHKTFGAQGVDSALHGAEPQQVHFKNRVSVGMHEEFVDKTTRVAQDRCYLPLDAARAYHCHKWAGGSPGKEWQEKVDP